MSESELQEACSKLVHREVHHGLNYLMSGLLKHWEVLSTEFQMNEDEIQQMISVLDVDTADDPEPQYDEVYEHWAVSDWFARKLKDQGETVVEFADFNVWCRMTTGQAIYMDSVIRRIYKTLP